VLEEEWDLAMAKRLAEVQRVRRLVLGEGLRQVSREGRCPSNDGFPKGGFILLLRNNLPSSMWETSIVSPEIQWWNPNFYYNLAFCERKGI